jgi:hypothetical protein
LYLATLNARLRYALSHLLSFQDHSEAINAMLEKVHHAYLEKIDVTEPVLVLP